VSVSTTQGTCPDRSEGDYHSLVCSLGPLASGASATIVAVVEVNESMNHFSALLPTPFEGGYQDADNSDNESEGRVTASVPPTIAGSKKIKLSGLPAGCAPGNFTLRAVANAKGVKKMRASLFYVDASGDGQTWQKVSAGNHLTAKVPAARLPATLGAFYTLKVKAKRGGKAPLTATVTLQPC
jgi:hypothetical protein